MAVKDESLYHATDELILPKPRRYYHALIHTSHWQLRCLVSSPEQNIVYYPSGPEILRLDTRTRERQTVSTLTFSPRCLAASKQWLCCGGDHGDFTAICLGDGSVSPEALSFSECDPDSRLPLELDPSRRSSLRDMTTRRRSRPRDFPLSATVTKVGSEIVNCITLWTPTKSTSDRTYKAPVAVVSNNDKTVSIVDLKSLEVVEEITLPDCVNRAVMSPDGEMLVMICDDPYLYVYERKRRFEGNIRFDSRHSPQYDWALGGTIQLTGQRQSDKCNMRGSFAVCFSQSGGHLAVATQYGTISIFDTRYLKNEEVDPLVTVFTTSRPGRECGAVRAMEFSPGPVDLLAWTESSGRVGVADLRSSCFSRQLVQLDSHEECVERVMVSEATHEPVIDPRLRSLADDASSSSTTTPDYLGMEFDRRQLRQLTREMSDRHQSPLTPEEMEVLQAHRMARRQRDAANAAREAMTLTEGGGRSRWASRAENQRSIPTAGEGSGSGGARSTSSTALPPILREFADPERLGGASFRSFINDRNLDRERRMQLLESRRRSAILAATADQVLGRATSGNDAASDLERLTIRVPRLPAVGVDSSVNAWGQIDAIYRSTFPTDPPVDRVTRLRMVLEDDDRLDFAQRLRQPWRPLDDSTTTGARDEASAIRGVLRSSSVSVETMGCCWSEDGRVLYAGAEDGIHEFHVNVAGRKRFPSLVLR